MQQVSMQNVSLAVGREALEMAAGDLQTALRQESLRAEIVVAWLDREMKRLALEWQGSWQAHELVLLAADTLDDLEQTRIRE